MGGDGLEDVGDRCDCGSNKFCLIVVDWDDVGEVAIVCCGRCGEYRDRLASIDGERVNVNRRYGRD